MWLYLPRCSLALSCETLECNWLPSYHRTSIWWWLHCTTIIWGSSSPVATQEQVWLGSSPHLHSCRTTGKPQHLSGARKSALSTFSAQGPVARSSTSFAESASTSLFQTFVFRLIMTSFWHLPFCPKQRAEIQDMFVTSRAGSHVAQD